jgi:Zn-dependent oligopeptidase
LGGFHFHIVFVALFAVLAPDAWSLDRKTWKAFEQTAKDSRVIVRFPLIPSNTESVRALARDSLRQLELAIERIEKRPLARANFQNTVVALDSIDDRFGETDAALNLAMALHQNTEVYDAALESLQQMHRRSLKWLRSSELRNRVQHMSKIPGLLPEQKELAARTITSFDTVGSLNELIENSKLSGLWERLYEKEAEFQKTLLRPTSTLAFTETQLEGLSPESLAMLPRKGNKYLVSPKAYNETSIIFAEAKHKKTRDEVLHAILKIGVPENLQILREMLALRQSISKHLQRRSWAEYQLEGFSISAANVARELSQVLKKTRAWFDESISNLKVRGDITDADFSHEAAQQTRSILPSNPEAFFPYPHVLNSLLEMIGQLYGVEVVELEEAPVWHPTVQVFGVVDAADKTILGAFAIDPFPRAGKDNWFWCLDMIFPRSEPDSTVSKRPFTVMMTNFPTPTENQPSLLKPTDVPTLAHELGHVFHSLLTQSAFYKTTSSSELSELREVPSTFLERLTEQPVVLSRLSSHWQTGEKIGVPTLEAWSQSRAPSRLVSLRGRALNSLLDLKLHTASVPKLSTLESRLLAEHSLGLAPDHSVLASFDYVTGGYDALYWTYLWATAIADKMVLSALGPDGSLNSEYGMHVRQALLEKNSQSSPSAILAALLGEKPKLCSWLLRAHL